MVLISGEKHTSDLYILKFRIKYFDPRVTILFKKIILVQKVEVFNIVTLIRLKISTVLVFTMEVGGNELCFLDLKLILKIIKFKLQFTIKPTNNH